MVAPLYFSRVALRTGDPAISYFMQQAVESPNLISLAAGLVDAESLPGGYVAEAVRKILERPESMKAALQYGTTQGYQPLRAAALEHFCRLDQLTPAQLNLDTNHVLITTGSQQLLYLIAEAMLDTGDTVIASSPSYFVFNGLLQSVGTRTLTVPGDDHGMNTAALEELLHRMNRSERAKVRLIYAVSYFENPTGASLSLERRKHLLDLVRRYSIDHRILILEDAAYRELRYDGEELPSLKSLDPENHYVVTGMTFSKPCAPGLKTGYGLGPTELIDTLVRLKGNHDFGSTNFTQHILMEMLRQGTYHKHVEELVRVYRQKRDAMLAALEAEMKPEWGVRWRRPLGGLYIWVTLPPNIPCGAGTQFLQDALAEGVLYVPGELSSGSKSEMRLSFGVEPPSQLREGVRRLARAVAKQFVKWR
jgi:2-aminoadipate transaminase